MGLRFSGVVFMLGIAAAHLVQECSAQEEVYRVNRNLSMDGCGISKAYSEGGKIVGGRDSLEGEHPWLLSFEMQLVPLFTDFQHVCGASLINRNWAVTAAHCIAGGPFTRYRVRAGAYNITIRGAPRQTTHSVLPIVHEGYNPVSSMANDIAMLRLATPVDMTSSDGYIVGICLPPASYENQATGTARVAGWGTTSQGGSLSRVMQCVDVPIISNDDCREAYGDNIDDGMICAGYAEGGRDSCQGDSGGPLTQRSEDGASTLVGIVSWGKGCAQAGYPGVYTETAHFIDWIARTMQTGIPQVS